MKKKFLIILLTLSCCLLLSMVLTGCDAIFCKHNLTHHERVEATCTKAGSVEHWECSECGGNFADAKAKRKIRNVVIEPSHKFEDKYSYDRENHWYAATCSHFNVKKDCEPHVFDGNSCKVCFFNPNEGLVYKPYEDGYAVVNYFGDAVNVVVPSQFEGKPVVAIGTGDTDGFAFVQNVETVILPKTLRQLNRQSFAYCSALQRIDIPDSVTTIADDAFNGCENLMSVTIGDGVTSIGKAAFRGCQRLYQVTIGMRVAHIGESAFHSCVQLDRVYILDLGAWVQIKFDNWQSNPVSFAHKLYVNGILLTDAVIPDGIKEIGEYAFYRCSCIERLYIPSSLTLFENDSFANCVNLKGVYITDIAAWCNIEFKTCPLNFANELYFNGELIKDLVIPSSVKKINAHSFKNLNLMSLTYSDQLTEICEYAFSASLEVDELVLDKNLKVIGNNAFQNIKATSLIITDNVTHIGSKAFYESKIKALSVVGEPTIDERAFEASSLEKISFDSLKTIGKYMFSSCDEITSLTIPDSVNYIDSHAFSDCSGLREVVLHHNLTLGENVFYNCKNLINVVFPNDLTEIPNGLFQKCHALANITLPNSVKKIGASAFSDCISLTDITLPSGLEVLEEDAFSNCISLKSLSLPSGLKVLGNNVFNRCTELEIISLPSGLSSIGDEVFTGCERLKKIIIPSSVQTMGGRVFIGCERLTIYCEAANKPEGWHVGWNYGSRPVTWGYRGDE